MTEAIIKLARERRDAAHKAMLVHHERAVDDLRFVRGEHYPEDVRQEREANGQPCLTVNNLPQFVRQVTGQIRALNPAIRVIAGDGDASADVAEVIEGLIRHIENRSDASSVYEAAAESAAACSLGFWRIRSDYEGDDTFDQEILIERVYNPFAVFLDPQAKHPTRSDAQWGFIVEDMPVEAFKEAYPTARTEDFTSDHKPDWTANWAHGDAVTVAEYFWIEFEEYTIGLAPDGTVIKDPKPPMAYTKTRKVKAPRVKWAKISGAEVLEGPEDFPSRYIPIVAVTGEEWHYGEESYISSVIRFAKDPALMYDYAISTSAEVIALQPKSPYLLTAKQISGRETEWAEANSANTVALVYTPDPAAPPPIRVPSAMSSEGLTTTMQIAAEDQKRTTGIYDAGLGARSNETSGKAIMARKEESQNSTSIYADNMVKSVMHTGKIILDMIPKIYDAKRTVRILGEDDKEKIVVINDLLIAQDGIQPVNDVTIGKYDVRIQVGPSYQTKRQEGQDGMMEFMRVVPQASQVAGDIFAGMQDWPEADRVQERLKKTLPPGLETPDPDDMTPEEQQAMQAQMMQAQEQQAMQQQALQLEMREKAAKAGKAEAEAKKAEAEAAKMEFELATLNGSLTKLVEDAVAQALIRASGN